jgi:DNA-directed RNA polymerase specialized sigma24 family protein
MDIPLSALLNTKGLSLCEQPVVRKEVWAIAVRLERDPLYFGREDLLQEGLLRIWLAEKERPGQAVSWYLQNVEFHLRNLLRAGRSLDSAKRRSGLAESPLESDEQNEALDAAALDDDRDLMSQICADDMIAGLHRSLNGLDNAILDLSLEGHGRREIARHLDLDRAKVAKHLGKIATIAEKFSRIFQPVPRTHSATSRRVV